MKKKVAMKPNSKRRIRHMNTVVIGGTERRLFTHEHIPSSLIDDDTGRRHDLLTLRLVLDRGETLSFTEDADLGEGFSPAEVIPVEIRNPTEDEADIWGHDIQVAEYEHSYGIGGCWPVHVTVEQHSKTDLQAIALLAHSQQKTEPEVEHARPIFWPLDPEWRQVEWKGEPIDLRAREKARAFLRLLWGSNAKRRSQAIGVTREFRKPSSLFRPGERTIKTGIGPFETLQTIPSEQGEKLHRLYKEAVGKVPPRKKGKGRTRYYLKAFSDSSST